MTAIWVGEEEALVADTHRHATMGAGRSDSERRSMISSTLPRLNPVRAP